MGKGTNERDEAMLEKYTAFIAKELVADMTERLAGVPGQMVMMLRENFKTEHLPEKFLAKMRKHQADRSPTRKADKKSKKKKDKGGEAEEADTPKPAKKRKDANAPKGARNAKTMFKIVRAADFVGLGRDERFKREKELWDALTEDQQKVYTEMYEEDKKRLAREMELYKKGEFKPGKTPLPEIRKEAEPAKEAPKVSPVKVVKRTKKAPEEEEKKPKKAPAKKALSSSSSSSSSSSDKFDLGIESDD